MNTNRGKWFDWAELVRLPNVFTVLADVLMGFLFVRSSLQPARLFLFALGASVSLYWAGMILNDVYDYDKDAKERASRPLPSGRIPLGLATRVGYVLLVVGIALAAIAGNASETFDLRPGSVALGLAVCVLLYDRWLKATPLGPIAMGGCRTLNILLAMACAGQGTFDPSQLVVAFAFGVYIAGVTWFARNEAGENNRGIMVGGLLVLIAGLSLLASFPQFGEFAVNRRLALSTEWIWPMLVLLLGCSIVRRCVVAIVSLEPARIGAAVKQCILSLIVLDAAVCLAVRSPVWWAVGIVALLIPALAVGNIFYST